MTYISTRAMHVAHVPILLCGCNGTMGTAWLIVVLWLLLVVLFQLLPPLQEFRLQLLSCRQLSTYTES